MTAPEPDAHVWQRLDASIDATVAGLDADPPAEKPAGLRIGATERLADGRTLIAETTWTPDDGAAPIDHTITPAAEETPP